VIIVDGSYIKPKVYQFCEIRQREVQNTNPSLYIIHKKTFCRENVESRMLLPYHKEFYTTNLKSLLTARETLRAIVPKVFFFSGV
jgi:hypothetical protein